MVGEQRVREKKAREHVTVTTSKHDGEHQLAQAAKEMASEQVENQRTDYMDQHLISLKVKGEIDKVKKCGKGTINAIQKVRNCCQMYEKVNKSLEKLS